MGGYGAIAGLIGGIMQGMGARQTQNQKNKMLQQAADMLNNSSVRQYMMGLNPYLMQALSGQKTNNPFEQQWYNLATNPGYIDPALMNMPYNQIAQGGANNLSRFQGMVGKSTGGAAGGGLASAYGLANLMGQTGQRAQTAQQYSLFREQQRRADMDMLMKYYMQNADMASTNLKNQAGIMTGKNPAPNWLSMGGNAIESALAGSSGQGYQSGNLQPTSFWQGSTSPMGNAPANLGGGYSGGMPSNMSFNSFNQAAGTPSSSGSTSWGSNLFGGSGSYGFH